MKAKKIIFIGSFFLSRNGHYGGVYLASTQLKDKLEKEGFKIVKLDTTLKDINVTKLWLRFPSIILRQFYFLWKTLKNIRANTILIYLSGGNSYIDKFPVILLAYICRKKIILFPRSGHLIHDYNTYKNYFIQKCFNKASLIICQSKFWENFFISKNISQNKLQIIENWVPQTYIEESQQLEFPNYQINKKCFRITYVSRIEEAKGVMDLIGIAKILKGKFDFIIDIYGEGSFREKLIDLIKENELSEIITYKGWLNNENKLKTINTYHLGIFTSRFEGFPNSLYDFIFSKTPIIAFDIESVRAIGGDNILYYSNCNELVKKIKKVRISYNSSIQSTDKLLVDKTKYNNIEFAYSKLENHL